MFAAEQIGKIDDARRLRRRHLPDDIVELGDVAAHDLHLLAQITVIRGGGIDVHADDLLAALGEQRDQAPADKAGTADNEDGHGLILPWPIASCVALARA